MRYCNKCVMPDTKPDLHFDEQGVCDACRSAELKETGIDWNERRLALEQIIEQARSKDGSRYDCIVPVSGGKDSFFQTYTMLEYGLKPLCVSFEPTYPTELGKVNLTNLGKLGVDIIQLRKNPHVYRRLCQIAFRRVGDHDWPNHVGIFTFPIRQAINYGIPLIVWGENSQLEYGGPLRATQRNCLDRRWLEEFGGLLGYRVADMVDEGIPLSDLKPYSYPTDEELKNAGVLGIFLGYYLKWDARPQVEIVKKLGFTTKQDGPVEGTYTDYENLDCAFTAVHDYLKFVKFGFGRATDHACLDIRNGRITRDQGIELVKEYDGKLPRKALSEFLNYMEMNEEEFHRIVDSFTNRHIFEQESNRKFARDADGNLIKKAQLQSLLSSPIASATIA
ncbi:MAG TPA: N-acetyl sugar amidotransferase [Oculatellaceae cyanobacterium]